MSKWSVLIAIGLATLSITGCGEDPAVVAARKAEVEAKAKLAEAEARAKKEEDDARKSVIASLKDPDSAKFGKFAIAGQKDGNPTACLAVNAKNSYGGYTGEQTAMLVKVSGEWQVITIGMKVGPKTVGFDECLTLLKS